MSTFGRLAVIGAGNMGSGIAQKMATEGFQVTLVDVDETKVARGLDIVKRTLDEGVERKVFRLPEAQAIRARIEGTTDWSRLAEADLVVEAVFEDPQIKRDVFERLDAVCRNDAILATNTSSLSVSELARATRRPERVLGLHYFYHPAKNRLVEVVPGQATRTDVVQRAWALQEQMGKTPIASADAFGFVVNRYFVPWLNEAVRLLEEGLASIPSIEAACKQTFGAGMGPFELMNVTGIPIALHAATTLGQEFGPFYAPAQKLRQQVDSNRTWSLDGVADPSRTEVIAERMQAVVFYVASSLVDEEVGSLEDTDIGARVGLRWPRGPFEMMNRIGIPRATALVGSLTERWDLKQPRILASRAQSGEPFEFRLVTSTVRDGVATLTINRPDALNALNEAVVRQLHDAFRAAAADPRVRGVVIAGSGKAFIAGADIRFFVRHIEAGSLERIVEFTRAGHALLNEIDRCPKPVVARLHGLALGGGLELALACDWIIATPKAALAFPETGIGIYPGLGGTQRTPRRTGCGLAKWLIFTGQTLPAAQALAIGLIDRVVPHDELDGAIREAIERGPRQIAPAEPPTDHADLARFFAEHAVEDLRQGRVEAPDDPGLAKALKRVAGKAPIALRIAEQLIDESTRLDLEAGLERELGHLVEIFRTEDAHEGLATLGKRQPEFKGR